MVERTQPDPSVPHFFTPLRLPRLVLLSVTVEPGQGPENELFVCLTPSVTSQYLSPGVEGRGGGITRVSVEKEGGSVASDKV